MASAPPAPRPPQRAGDARRPPRHAGPAGPPRRPGARRCHHEAPTPLADQRVGGRHRGVPRGVPGEARSIARHLRGVRAVRRSRTGCGTARMDDAASAPRRLGRACRSRRDAPRGREGRKFVARPHRVVAPFSSNAANSAPRCPAAVAAREVATAALSAAATRGASRWSVVDSVAKHRPKEFRLVGAQSALHLLAANAGYQIRSSELTASDSSYRSSTRSGRYSRFIPSGGWWPVQRLIRGPRVVTFGHCAVGNSLGQSSLPRRHGPHAGRIAFAAP